MLTVERSFFSQDMAFFDNPENGTGAICSRLATDVSTIQGVSNETIPQIYKITLFRICNGKMENLR